MAYPHDSYGPDAYSADAGYDYGYGYDGYSHGYDDSETYYGTGHDHEGHDGTKANDNGAKDGNDHDDHQQAGHVSVFHAVSALRTFDCRMCGLSFSSNNRLHQHIKACPNRQLVDPMRSEPSRTAFTGKRPTQVGPVVPSSIAAPVVSSSSRQSLGNGFAYRSFRYCTCAASLSLTAPCAPITPDSGNTMTLIDRKFLTEQCPNMTIRSMSRPIGIRGVGKNFSSSNEFAVVSVFLPGKLQDGSPAVAKVICEAHIIDNLPANILLGSDVMKPQGMDVLYSRDAMTIAACKGIEVPICSAIKDNMRINRLVKAQANTVIPPNSVASVPIDIKGSLPDRDFLFDPDLRHDLKPSVGRDGGPFSHVVAADISFVQVYNATSTPAMLPRNARLGHLKDFDDDRALPAHASVHHLAADASPLYSMTAESDDGPLLFVKSPPTDEDAGHFSDPPRLRASTDSNDPSRTEQPGLNGENLFGTPTERNAYQRVLDEVPELFQDDGKLINLPEDRWMKIPLADNWRDHPHRPQLAHKPYRQGTKAEQAID